MADIIHRTERNSEGKLLRRYSVNTPDYSTDNWIINPDLSSVSEVEEYYWKTSGDNVVEMTTSEKNSIDATRLSDAKDDKKSKLKNEINNFLTDSYDTFFQKTVNLSYTEGVKNKPKKMKYLDNYIDWIESLTSELEDKLVEVDSSNTILGLSGIELNTSSLESINPEIGLSGIINSGDSKDLDNFLDSNVEVTDTTGVKGPFYLMQLLSNRRELHNDTENPVYLSGHIPILGETGLINNNSNRILNLENIHSKWGWHYLDTYQNSYRRPKDVLFYYGYPNSFNSGSNEWDNEKVAQDMAKYELIILGDGVQDSGHADYSNTEVIIPSIKALNPRTLIFGYVSVDQTLSNFQDKVDDWNTLGVHGIFMDESGYDFGRTRAEFNTRVDYIHEKTNANICFANAWNTDHIIGTDNDTSYPNSTYNSSEVESNLSSSDWILLESFPINTTAYSGNNGYELGEEWKTRGDKIQNLRITYGVNFAGVGIINNDNANGQDLFDFGFYSAVMYCLDAFGTSDTSYGASSAQVTFWTRSDLSNFNRLFEIYPSVQQNTGNSDVFLRYAQYGSFELDFSTGAQSSVKNTW